MFIVIQLQLYAFSPHPSTPPQLNLPPSPTSTLPLDFVHVSFIVVPYREFLSHPPLGFYIFLFCLLLLIVHNLVFPTGVVAKCKDYYLYASAPCDAKRIMLPGLFHWLE